MPGPAPVVEALTRRHDRSRFDCASPALNRYLATQARQDAEKHVAAPFVALGDDGTSVVGYYTLSASVLNVEELPAALAKRLPRYPQLPVTLIGRLAVDRTWQGRGLGRFLLMDALNRCSRHAHSVAAMAVIVDAKDEAAALFYERFGFEALQTQPSRLFLPMATVEALFR